MFYLGNAISTLLWCLLSDAWGRRPVMITGLLVSVIGELLFGHRYFNTFKRSVVSTQPPTLSYIIQNIFLLVYVV